MNTFGDFLWSLRKEKGMTQAELAESLGVTNKAVSKWETGDAMPETSQLLPISRIFGVTVDELLAGERAPQCDNKVRPDVEPEHRIYADEIKNHIFTRGKDDGRDAVADKICGAVCASVCLLGVSVYLLLGAIAGLWTPYWIIVPLCPLSCGIIGIVFEMFNREKCSIKFARGENPYTGGACGIIMLSCIITYLCLGAFGNMWHPYWVIVACGAPVCGAVASVGAVFTHRKNKIKKDE